MYETCQKNLVLNIFFSNGIQGVDVVPKDLDSHGQNDPVASAQSGNQDEDAFQNARCCDSTNDAADHHSEIPSNVQIIINSETENSSEGEEREEGGEREEGDEQEALFAGNGHCSGINSSQPLTQEDILQRLALLYSKKGLSLSALKDVAQLIQDLGHDIPTDPRTILKTTNKKVGKESFHHFSLRDGILRKLKKGINDPLCHVIKLHISIDGIPIFKTHTIEMWPILCRFISTSDSEPFVVSIYGGKGKPKSAEEFLGPFLVEMLQLEKKWPRI